MKTVSPCTTKTALHIGTQQQADDVSERIEGIEHVANELFREWEEELDQYSSAELRRASADQLQETRDRYGDLIGAMRRAERRMEPVLTAFQDQVLFLKHNLNAQAIASLQGEVVSIENDVESLIREMEAAIAEAEAFVRRYRGE